MMNKYQAIINLPHHVSKVHKPMSLGNRGAQFAPFAALTGYDDMVKEQGIDIDEKKNLSEDEIHQINETIIKLKRNDIVRVQYYRHNLNHEITGKITKIELERNNIMVEKLNISFEEIVSICLNYINGW